MYIQNIIKTNRPELLRNFIIIMTFAATVGHKKKPALQQALRFDISVRLIHHASMLF